MDFKEILEKRYATKLFDGRKIPKEKLDELFKMILLSPSSYNLQPWKIKVVEDKKIKEELFAASYNQEQIRTCSHLLVFCAELDIEKNISLLEKELSKKLPEQKAKAYVQMLKEFSASMSEEQKKNWAQKQVYIAMQTTLLAAKYLGFDSCPMEGFEPEKYSKILKLPPNLIPTVVVPIGYAADKPKPKIRFSKEEVFF
ncbi:MAG: NAD(P)H-dependent oxidoreductase [Candidatus Micrarchaeota archaeon]|nr:NAD(P)H-dependent oxidoreductase [Candidatus Micrarchaeota archaeon]